MPGFIDQCYQWNGGIGNLPVFNNQQDLIDSGWDKYFEAVYGELPNSRFPICVGSLWFLNINVMKSLGNLGMIPLGNCPKGKAVDWYGTNNKYQPPWASWLLHPPPYGVNGQGFPGDTWIEISHEAEGRESSGMWFMFSMGSGVWFNTGKTSVYPDHQQAQDQFCGGCRGDGGNNKMAKSAASKGWDSLQFLRHPDDQWRCHSEAGNPPKGAMNVEIIAVKLNGKGACPPSAMGDKFRSGWNADKPCRCISGSHSNCQIG